MNKNIIVIGVLSLVVLTLGLAGYAYAQGQPPLPSDYPYGPEMMNGYDGHDDGMMGSGYGMMGSGMMGWEGDEGPMHESMIDSLAESLALTPQEIEARHDAGESIWEIAVAEGLTDEEISELMFSSHDAALEDAVLEGLLTREQVERMNDHMNQMWDGDYDHCGGESGFDSNTRWRGMDW
ncbi:MAG: hypothetical protein WBG94_13365 [Anaerolineales bacterium]